MRAAIFGLVAGALALAGCASAGGAGNAQQPASVEQLLAGVDVPYERFTLDNGLTVLVHEDRKAPIVAVAAWYNVGSSRPAKPATRISSNTSCSSTAPSTCRT
jgi:zinc protease